MRALNFGTSYDPKPTFKFAPTHFLGPVRLRTDNGTPRTPESLKFRFEANLGAADLSEKRLLASFNFYALYYLEGIAVGRFRPYIEGGAGIIYSDFQLEGQGLALEFQPPGGYRRPMARDPAPMAGTPPFVPTIFPMAACTVTTGGIKRDIISDRCSVLKLHLFY